MDVAHTSAQCTYRCAAFPYLENSWTNCAEIRYVVGNPLARRFTEVEDGVQLHVCTCTPLFHITGMAESTYCAEIWCDYGTNSDAFCRHYEWSTLQVLTHFRISVTNGRLFLKLGVSDTQ